MNSSIFFRRIAAIASAGLLSLQPAPGIAEDIDIFVGSSAGTHDRPNVLIVLDNTSNWARQSQQWPGGIQQGQAEVRSIKTVINALQSDAYGNLDVNVGVLEFVTNGTANDDGGFSRYSVKWMSAANKTILAAQMDQIFNDINGVNEKRNSNMQYGDLFWDVYNYFAGANVSVGGNSSNNGTGSLSPPNPYADTTGYTTAYSKFQTPLSKDNSCTKNYVIFISNPNSSGPASDGSGNNTILAGLGGNTSTIPLPNFTTTSVTSSSAVGTTTSCYGSTALCNGAVATEFPNCGNGFYSSCSCGSAPVADPSSCPSGSLRYSVIATDPAGTTDLGYEATCAANTNTCDLTGYTAQCTGTGVSCACSSASYSTTGCTGNKKKFMVVRTKANTTTANLGFTTSCYASQSGCSTSDYAATCATYPGGCSCSTPTTAGGSCAVGTGRYLITGTTLETVSAPNGTYDSTKGAPWHVDEWARFMYQQGVPVTGGGNQTVATYTIDVYNKQQNADHTALMMSTAKVGGGKYFAATNEEALVNALKKIFQEITSVNSTFASASLPVNATNRAQNENQVFIGMFRPDPEAQPRWFGNLKRYQLILASDGVTIQLGDVYGKNAINDQTGFVDDCATSFWTTDSPNDPADLTKGYYWSGYNINPSPASRCSTLAPGAQAYSDLPDGPTVEKGAVAEILRKGNNPSVTNTVPTWNVSRQTYTTADYTSLSLVSGISNASALTTTQQDWTAGHDTQNEDIDTNTTETRASIHGDVVHSRPLPINYGDKVVVYYGSNDGNFRAVNADTGKELWTLVPFEFAQPNFSDRLRLNSPLVSYPSVNMTITPTPIPKQYGWDGSIGLLQNSDDTKVWIYPTMRRGGRRIYAINVTDPSKDATAPSIKWIAGCNSDGTNCTTGYDNMGQTWSAPNITPVAGYTTEQVAFFGGGYDTCEDANTKTPSCSSPKGARVYAADAGSGTVLKAFTTDRSVVADAALLDIDGDGKADYAYAADTGGNLYRIDMVTRSTVSGSVTYTPRLPAEWTIRKIAATSGGRKFLFPPALFPVASSGTVYIAIGSGDREHPLQTDYPYADVVNRFYVYMDSLAVTTGSAANLDALTNLTTDPGCTATPILPGADPAGWFMNLTQYGQGEQTVTSAIIAGGLAAFSTNRPIPPVSGTCASPLGEARGYWVNLTTGSGAVGTDGTCGGQRSSIFVGGGLPPSPVIGTVPIAGKPRTVIIGAAQREGGASTPISPQKIKPSISPTRKRVYWKLQGVD